MPKHHTAGRSVSRWAWVTALVAVGLVAAGARAGQPAAGQWVTISDGVLAKLEADNVKIAWPGKTTGVVVDRTTGHLYMIVCGLGVWRSTDRGATFERVDGGRVGGRCETGHSLCADPGGRRIACFMLDGTSARTDDGGRTWTPVKNVARVYDWAAVDWREGPVKTVFGLVHESGGIGAVSRDGGASWKEIGKGYFAVGVFGPEILVCSREKEKGILRSTDAGRTWKKVHDATPLGALRVFKGAGYWLTDSGLLVSRDRGETWTRVGERTGAAWGPYFGKDENHFVVVDAAGFRETRDGGKTWRLLAPLPPPLAKEYNQRGWFLNVAWDPIGNVCYAARMGQPTYKYEVPPEKR